jgi:hypothetical protein
VSRLDELVAARKVAGRAAVAASDAARPFRDGYPADAPERAEAETRVTEARLALERAIDQEVLEMLRDGAAEPPPRRRSATAMPQLDLLLGAGGGR